MSVVVGLDPLGSVGVVWMGVRSSRDRWTGYPQRYAHPGGVNADTDETEVFRPFGVAEQWSGRVQRFAR
jgi:hypothetical protein